VAAREARDAATSAATHARNAGKAAREAAEQAGNSAQAAARSTQHANAATEAADDATAAVAKAQQIYKLSREVESAELLARTNAGIERARDDKEHDDTRTAAQTALEKEATDQRTERDLLVAQAAGAGADLGAVARQGRALAVRVMKKGGTAWGRAAAEAALGGTDETVLDYLRTGWQTAEEQDQRAYVARLAEESESKTVRDAAEQALDGDAATVAAFVDKGQYQVAAEDMRVAIAQTLDGAGPVLTDAGRKALNTGDPKQYSAFLTRTQDTARTQDERVRAAQLIDGGTPEVKAAARIALEGSPQALHAFIVAGQYQALRRDHLTATHVAQVQKMIADAGKVAATARKDAATAQQVAATARKAKDDAKDWATKANTAYGDAQAYAKQADQYAKDAEASAAKAAASAKTARDAANRADASAADAARSAADATLSSEVAQASASEASYYADQAWKSAVEAGKDSDAALKALNDAYQVALKKYEQEEKARRKAAVQAKEKAKNDPGARAREMYRCGQGYIPCDPQGFARWCQHKETYCDVLAHSKELSDAADTLWNLEKELLGLGQYEECMQNKDFDSCKGLAVDVLLSGKLKLLDRLYDKVKVLKKGCRILDKAPLRSASSVRPASVRPASAGLAAASGGVPCGEHKVPGLPRPTSKIPDSSDCRACAERIRESLGGGELKVIRPMRPFNSLPQYRGQDTFWGEHVVLVYNGRVYDGFGPKGGETISEFKGKWQYNDVIDFGF
ncbi:ALF repeat-containing protein, partial [Streptomyces sp. SID161]|uniref:ALF repeat-containing protein n=1 Tax=Streptomyces sp. SID161 TaxID=2690251 RepID=UPI001371E15D